MHLYQLILTIVSIILIYNIFDVNPEKNNKIEPTKSLRKIVTFNLDNNSEYEITNEHNEDPKHEKNVYGEKILNNNSPFSINNNKEIINPQEKLINRLNNTQSSTEIQKSLNVNSDFESFQNDTKKDDIFIDQKAYWNSLNIGDYTERKYLNTQVNDFNIFKRNSSQPNIEISKVYDDLTNGITDPTPLLHNDESILNSDDHIINGYSSECNNLTIEQN